jgi:hypothetical protein
MSCVISVARVSRRAYSCACAPETASVADGEDHHAQHTEAMTISIKVKPATARSLDHWFMGTLTSALDEDLGLVEGVVHLRPLPVAVDAQQVAALRELRRRHVSTS